jgi:DNA processing protein
MFGELVRAVRSSRLEAMVEREWSGVERIGCGLVTLADDDYPVLLREIPDPPPVLYRLGELVPDDELAVAVVGSRRASPYGRNAARWIAGDLARAGLTIVSGMARGIDSEAHRAALEAEGRTIAVLGSGLAHIYPRENRGLCESIVRRGAVLSPYPLDVPPFKQNFPERNRILSGLALGTLVVEAAERSGSLITARLAAEQNRDVFAVPGRITSGMSVGTNYLIKSGAKLVQSAADVLADMRPDVQSRLRPIEAGDEAPDEDMTAEEKRIVASLSADEATHIDRLAEKVPIGIPRLLESLLQLEIRRQVVHLPGQHYILRM